MVKNQISIAITYLYHLSEIHIELLHLHSTTFLIKRIIIRIHPAQSQLSRVSWKRIQTGGNILAMCLHL